MPVDDFPQLTDSPAGTALQAYLLGQLSFETALCLQQRLVYDVAGGAAPCLLLCEHTPILTVGRRGSHAHMLFERADLPGRDWRIRWVNRGGGCWLQLPGQLAINAVLPIQALGLPLREHQRRLQSAIMATLADFTVRAHVPSRSPDVWVNDRPVACLGVAVRSWVTYYGAVLNICPDLELFRLVRTGREHPPMTSLERERRGPVRPAMVRQRLLEHFAAQFGFARTSLFMEHPALTRKAAADALAATRG